METARATIRNGYKKREELCKTHIQYKGTGDRLSHNANIILTSHDPRAIVSVGFFLASFVSALHGSEQDQIDIQASRAMMSAPMLRWLLLMKGRHGRFSGDSESMYASCERTIPLVTA